MTLFLVTYQVQELCNSIDLKNLPERIGRALAMASSLPDDAI